MYSIRHFISLKSRSFSGVVQQLFSEKSHQLSVVWVRTSALKHALLLKHSLTRELQIKKGPDGKSVKIHSGENNDWKPSDHWIVPRSFSGNVWPPIPDSSLKRMLMNPEVIREEDLYSTSIPCRKLPLHVSELPAESANGGICVFMIEKKIDIKRVLFFGVVRMGLPFVFFWAIFQMSMQSIKAIAFICCIVGSVYFLFEIATRIQNIPRVGRAEQLLQRTPRLSIALPIRRLLHNLWPRTCRRMMPHPGTIRTTINCVSILRRFLCLSGQPLERIHRQSR
jgi:hypothetical protein